MSGHVPAGTSSSRLRELIGLGWLGGWLVLMWLAGVALHLLLPDRNPGGQCEGIGFGCVPSPSDSVLFLMLFVGAPITLAALVLGVPWVLVWGRRWPGWVAGSSAYALSVGVVALVLFAYVRREQ